MMNTQRKRPRGRPPGVRHNSRINARVPVAVRQALETAASAHGRSVTDFVRVAVDRLLGDLVSESVKQERDERLSPRTRVRAAAFIRQAIAAEVAMSPVGLQVARATAVEQRARAAAAK